MEILCGSEKMWMGGDVEIMLIFVGFLRSDSFVIVYWWLVSCL